MLREEARWIGNQLSRLDPARLNPLLNVGSGTAEMRERHQPWIEADTLAPARARGVTIRHCDLQPGEGVDLVGDLTDPAFLAELARHEFRSLLCCNVLEHVPDPAALCARLERLVPVGGYMVVTVPRAFPYHPDPIDTMFRPSVEDLARHFTSSRLVAGEVVDAGSGWDYVGRDPVQLVRRTVQRLLWASRNGHADGAGSFAPWLFRRFLQTCLVLERVE